MFYILSTHKIHVCAFQSIGLSLEDKLYCNNGALHANYICFVHGVYNLHIYT